MDRGLKEQIEGLLQDVYKEEVASGSSPAQIRLKVKDYALGLIQQLMDTISRPTDQLQAIKVCLHYERVIQGWISKL